MKHTTTYAQQAGVVAGSVGGFCYPGTIDLGLTQGLDVLSGVHTQTLRTTNGDIVATCTQDGQGNWTVFGSWLPIITATDATGTSISRIATQDELRNGRANGEGALTTVPALQTTVTHR